MQSTNPVMVPGALPLLGHVLPLLRDPCTFLTSLPAHGDLVRIRLGRSDAYVVCTPELTRHVLLHDRVYDKGGALVSRGREVLGNGLGTCPHDQHRRQRRLIQPSFSPQHFPDYAQIMTQQIARVTAPWQDGQTLDVLAEMHKITARSFLATMFADAADDGGDFDRLLEDVATVVKGFYLRTLMPPQLDRLPAFGNRRYYQARHRIRQTISSIITARRADGTDRGDLLSALLAAQAPTADGTLQGMSDSELIDQCVSFFAAAMDSTAAVVAWALYFLALHPDVERRLHEEVDTVLTSTSPPTLEDISRLPFASRIITETLRLYPPGWFITRVTTCDTHLNGSLIPSGSTIFWSAYVIHHRPDLYRDPERFDPDRWADGQEAASVRRGELVPFAYGPRKCIGDNFGTIEATLALVMIAARWKLSLAPGVRVRPAARAVLSPRGLSMIATLRAGHDND